MIAVIDYGMGNLGSVQRAIQKVGGRAELVRTASDLSGAVKIVLPGVAAFGDAMEQLRSAGLIETLVEAIRQGTPYLGICLGLQFLFDISYENGRHTGLGLIPGKVVRFDFDSSAVGDDLAVPHMGWNQIRWERPCPLFEGMDSGSYVYFAHSYHVVPMETSVAAAHTVYGYPFASAVWRDNVFGTQFHPEKSQSVGLKMLENFVNL